MKANARERDAEDVGNSAEQLVIDKCRVCLLCKAGFERCVVKIIAVTVRINAYFSRLLGGTSATTKYDFRGIDCSLGTLRKGKCYSWEVNLAS